jgi:hypothetical protein
VWKFRRKPAALLVVTRAGYPAQTQAMRQRRRKSVLSTLPTVCARHRRHRDAVPEIAAVRRGRIAYIRYLAKKRKYEPGIFEGRVMTPADLEQVHEEISASSGSKRCPMRCAR